MKKNFIDDPQAWLKTPRRMERKVEDAYPIERSKLPYRAVDFTLAISAIVIILILVGYIK